MQYTSFIQSRFTHIQSCIIYQQQSFTPINFTCEINKSWLQLDIDFKIRNIYLS